MHLLHIFLGCSLTDRVGFLPALLPHSVLLWGVRPTLQP
jgi:hypothetical protein